MSQTQYDSVQEIFKTYEANIGIEVHCQLATASKSFCTSANEYGTPPNTNIDPTCVGLPGALPVFNEACVDLALRMGLAMNCDIQPISIFARKNYFYPDLPKGYQITQFDKPICLNGSLTLESGKVVRLERIQIEEDAGKSLHVGATSLVDYNRSGVGLVEIVSRPDLTTPEECSEYLRALHALAVNLGVTDGDMERGNFRMDANVSIRPRGSATLGQRAEIKNVNSFKYLEKAIAYEITRQHEVIQSGGKIVMETRGYDSDRNETFSQRSKEAANDYRYFPEPDLPPLIVSPDRIERVRKSMPELPEAMAARWMQDYGMRDYDAKVLSSSRRNSQYFEALVKSLQGKVEIQQIANYMLTEVLRAVKVVAENNGMSPEDLTEVPVPLQDSIELMTMVASGEINGRIAKDVFEEMLASGAKPAEIVEKKGLKQVSDDGAIRAMVQQVLDSNPSQLQEYLGGKDKLFGFFVGQAIKASGGKMNPGKVNEALKEALDQRKKLG